MSSANNQTPSDRLPRGWISLRLDDIAPIATGGTPSTRVQSNFGDDFPFVSPGDIGNSKYVYTTTRRLSKTGFEQCRSFPEGSILFVSIGSTIGKCAVASELLTANQQINAVLPSETVASDFLYYALCERGATIRAQAGEQAVPIVNKSQFGSTPISFPIDKHEQILIGSALSDADALIDSLEQLLTKKRQIKQGAMQELLTGQRRLPGFDRPWQESKLRQLGTFLKGSGIRRDEALSGDLPCVRYGEIYTTHSDHIRSFSSWISPVVAATSTVLRRGDLLFAGSGETKEEIGKCVAFLYNEPAYAGGDIVILRPTVEADSMFLGYLLNMPFVVRQKASRGQGDAVVHISANALGEIEVELPKVAEQTAIAQALSDMDTEITALESRLTKARALKQAMAQALLTGRIRLVEPTA